MKPYVGLRKVKDGRFAFYCEQLIAEQIIPKLFNSHEMCDTKKIPFRRHFPIGIIINKLSPFRERLFRDWMWLSETGINNQALKFWQRVRIACDFKAYFSSVRFEYLSSLFLFLYIAHVMAFCLLCVEIIVDKLNKMR